MSGLALFTGGLFATPDAKTAHGILRYGDREVTAVVDAVQVGRRSDEVVPFVRRSVPIVADVAAATALGADRLVLGVASDGGRLAQTWRSTILGAIDAGMAIEAGLHDLLGADAELVAAAHHAGVELRDLRLAPDDVGVLDPDEPRPDGLAVVLTVGSDCAVGKKATALELHRAARAAGLPSTFVPTGQTGVAIAGWGIAVDHVLADYIAGAGQWLVREGARRGRCLWIEGQGAINHPAYSGVTLGLLHGTRPDALVLVHRAGSDRLDGFGNIPIPPLEQLVARYDELSLPGSPARVRAIALDTSRLDEAAAAAAIAETSARVGLPVVDPVRGPVGPLLTALAETIEPLGQISKARSRPADARSAAESPHAAGTPGL